MHTKFKHLIEKLNKTKTVFKGKFLKIIEDTVDLPNNDSAIREYVDHPGASAIIAVNNENKIAIIHQYRHCVKQVMIEIPAGKIDPNEDHLDTAKRELLEETGISAKNWTYLGSVLPCVGYSNEEIFYYLAKDLHLGAQKLDHGELVEVEFIDQKELLQLAKQNQITDGKTLSGLMLYLGYLEQQ